MGLGTGQGIQHPTWNTKACSQGVSVRRPKARRATQRQSSPNAYARLPPVKLKRGVQPHIGECQSPRIRFPSGRDCGFQGCCTGFSLLSLLWKSQMPEQRCSWPGAEGENSPAWALISGSCPAAGTTSRAASAPG